MRFARSSSLVISAAFALCSFAAAVSCKSLGGASPSPPPGVTVASITVTSHAFSEGGPIPVDNGCDGKDVFPGLIWSAPPPNASSLALIVDDPDARGGTFTHFIAFNLPPDGRSLPEGADPSKPGKPDESGARIGRNDFDAVRYNGPCPPKREEHHFRFTLYALDVKLNARDGASRKDVDQAMSGHVLGQGTLTGRFSH